MNNFLLFETERYQVFLNETDQFYLGRSVIVLKRETRSLSEITPEEWVDFGLVVRIFESSVKKSFGAVNFNWSCTLNDLQKPTSTLKNLYWHVRPRYSADVKFNKMVFKDYQFTNHYQVRKKILLSQPFLNLIALEIRKNL